MEQLMLVSGFLQACDYNVRTESHFVAADKPGTGGAPESLVVWVEEDTPEAPDPVAEHTLIRQLTDLSRKYARARLVFLTSTREGLSRDFTAQAMELGFRIRVPVEFFDAAFRSEVAREATDAAREVVESGEKFRQSRVKQAFRLVTPKGECISGDDLVADIVEKMTKRSTQPCIRFILGPAGSGKSVAFNEIYADLYKEFHTCKKRRVVGKRPLPLLPEHLRAAVGTRVSAIIDAFLRTDIATPLRREALIWLVDKQFMCFMLDGLDEILVRDHEFFDFLLDRITTPEAAPDVLICVRDSLLSSCDVLADFLEDASDWVERYEVQTWDRSSKEQYASRRFGSASQAKKFVDAIELPTLNRLSSLPFYCRCFADQFEQGRLSEYRTQYDALKGVLDHIVEREYAKHLFDPKVFPRKQIDEWLAAAAAAYLDKQLTGVPLDQLKEFGEILAPSEVSEEQREALVTHLAQFALFQKSGRSGDLMFSHEVIGYFLVALHLVDKLERNAEGFERDMGQMNLIPYDPLLRLLAEAVNRRQQTAPLIKILVEGVSSSVAYRNMMQVALFACPELFPEKDLLRNFSGRDLSNIVFEQINLTGANFRQANLSSAFFNACVLCGAQFEGAIIKNTRFDETDLKDAHFGGYDTVFSVRTGSRTISEMDAARKWLQAQSSVCPRVPEPCPTACQLRHLFTKYVYPNGEPRRAEIDIKGLTAGKKYPGAAAPHECVKEAVSLGYLRQESGRKGVRRPEGSKYAEIVDYVTRFRLSNGLAELLNRVCPLPKCPHVPRLG